MLRIRLKPGASPNPFNRRGAEGQWIQFTPEWREVPEELAGENIRLSELLEIEELAAPVVPTKAEVATAVLGGEIVGEVPAQVEEAPLVVAAEPSKSKQRRKRRAKKNGS